jgi:tRNA modification GTPase
MRAPRSYTRQDVVEFHVGAWPALEPMVLEGLAAAGVRPAEPGEFTFRAFSAGRLDLAQAEAVMAVVRASSEAALRAAGDLLRGRLSRDLEGLADRLAGVLGLVEADLDFSDQDLALAPRAEVAARIEGVRQALADLGRRSRSLETYSGDVRLVLAGWPNVGKSSLFNRLLAADRAIVAPRPGTTRDELRAALHIGEFEFVLSDTAGLQDARDELAGKARRMALLALARADLVLLVLDATAPSYERTDALLALVAAPMVAAVTKCDLGPPDRARRWLRSRGFGGEVVAASAVTGQGLADLRAALVRAVEGGDVDRQAAQPAVTARHRAAMEQAAAALGRAANLVGSAEGGELVALELREALDALGAIVGRRTPEDVLRGIFERFCIGK